MKVSEARRARLAGDVVAVDVYVPRRGVAEPSKLVVRKGKIVGERAGYDWPVFAVEIEDVPEGAENPVWVPSTEIEFPFPDDDWYGSGPALVGSFR